MKLCLLLLPLLALLPLSSSNTLSPVKITESDCQAYTSWSLSMADPTGTTTTSSTTISGNALPMLNYDGLTTLEYNGVTYTSKYLYFKVPAEHILPQSSTAYAAELQIEMTSSTGGTGVISFLIQNLGYDSADSTNWLQAYFNSPYYTVLSSYTSSNWDINLQTLSDLLAARVTSSGFLNFYNYDGSLTRSTGGEAEWFVQGSVLYATPTVITAITTNAGSITSATTSLATTRICFTGYFDVYMNQNYGLWFGVVSILLFFIFTLIMGDKPIDDPDYHEDVWTHHPLASVYKYGNELHTRKSRCSLVLIMVTMHALFSSVFFRKTSDPTRASNVIVYAIYSTLIDLVVTFFVGNMLRRYYLAKYQFAKTHEEAWEQKSQNRLFAYYIIVFGIIAVGWSFCVWNMGELHAEIDPKASNLWVAAFFIGLGLEILIIYPIACVLAKGSNFIRRIIKSVGFMYDNICHETYMDYIKQD